MYLLVYNSWTVNSINDESRASSIYFVILECGVSILGLVLLRHIRPFEALRTDGGGAIVVQHPQEDSFGLPITTMNDDQHPPDETTALLLVENDVVTNNTTAIATEKQEEEEEDGGQ